MHNVYLCCPHRGIETNNPAEKLGRVQMGNDCQLEKDKGHREVHMRPICSHAEVSVGVVVHSGVWFA